MRMLLHWSFVVLFAGTVAMLTGCAMPVPNAKAEAVVESKFDVGKAPKIVVEMFNGGIDIFAVAEEGAVQAKVIKRGQGPTDEEAQKALKNIEVKMTKEGDTVHIIARRLDPQVQGCGASATVEVPPGAVVDLRTANGGVNVVGLTGGVVTTTSNGGVKVKGNKGPVQAETSNGGIAVEGVTGLLDLKTSNGNVEIDARNALVKARTSNGGIRFKGSLADGEQSFHSSNGRIGLTLPAESRFRVEAQTSNGRITTDFPVKGASKQRKNHLEGTVGAEPSMTLKLQTSNGGIEIKKGA
jgi:DUF4097 and DUF4098 domain-containing protein YvlB